jgi:hypothetical protein
LNKYQKELAAKTYKGNIVFIADNATVLDNTYLGDDVLV